VIVGLDCVALDKLAVRTYEEVGAEVGLTKQAVQQIERRALRKLRLRLRDVLLSEYQDGVAWLDRLERDARERDRLVARISENRRRARAGISLACDVTVKSDI